MNLSGSGGRSFDALGWTPDQAKNAKSTPHALSVYVATWNVNGKSPEGSDVSMLLAACDKAPDVYAVGLQEVGLWDTWETTILNGLHPSGNYKLLESVLMGNIRLLVFVRKPLLNSCLQWHETNYSTNLFNTKGAVGISLFLDSVSICFVNAHFCPHQHQTRQRQADHDAIFRELIFDATKRGINEHDVVFFFGDLNYRMNNNPARMRTSLDYRQILDHDQLIGEMRLGNVFAGYREVDITFMPTYKYDPGTDNWDTSDKRRDPAYCDRILWRGGRVKPLSYQSVMGLKLSDHKPVHGLYEIVNEPTTPMHMPQESTLVSLHQREVHFPSFKFGEVHTRTLKISNRRRMKAFVRFSLEQQNTHYHDNWMEIEPKECELSCGQFLDITLTLRVSTLTACVLQSKIDSNIDPTRLGHILLQQPDEDDQRVAVFGSYMSGCFGHTMANLNFMIDSYHRRAYNRWLKQRVEPPKVPKLITKLVQHLLDHALDVPNLFVDLKNKRNYRDHSDISSILQYFDSDLSDDIVLRKCDPHAVAETLLMLLESSPQPLISPTDFYVESNLKNILPKMEPTNRLVFLYIMRFLKICAKHKSTNKMDTGRLSMLFGEILLKPHPASKNPKQIGHTYDSKRTMFLVNLFAKYELFDENEILSLG